MSVYCQFSSLHTTAYTPGSERTPTKVVLDAISHATNQDVTDLPVLYEHVDADGLDRIFADAAAEAVLSFSVADVNVFIRGDGQIRICDATTQAKVARVFERQVI